MKKIQAFFFRDFEQTYMPEILKEIYRDRVYDPFLRGKKDLTIVDLGANIGLWTYYAYPFASKIYSLEPAAEHYEVLSKMISFNQMDNAVAIKKAVANKNGKETFYHNANTTMFSLSQAVNNKPEEAEEVDVVTIKRLMEQNQIDKIDFLKIDVEGAECEIFGGEAFGAVADRIDTIVGEYHDWTGVNPHQLEASLTDRGFDFTWLNKTQAKIFAARNNAKK